ncbi:hypothetical protein BCR34DRAFT_599770 [Clohesyomyces aquaticus]|uniref:Uncharacterized protein n=1 Tax=Clohesyomyces aquaticus TaxID=1231657 RepID=A0A1Y1ZTP8_9PLEO|nr:hypothetical protein BCR34DRAFT_599770 [Clohesyomyces aquaticus]
MIRLHTRSAITRNISGDGYLMAIALMLSIIISGFVLNRLNYGLGNISGTSL